MGCFRDFTSGIAKYIIFFLNLLILICAIALIALGVIYRNDNAGLDLMSISSFTIAVGALIALIAFFGCCGAIRENSCMLTTYAAILLTLFIIQVVLGILAFVAIKNGDDELLKEVRDHLTDLYAKRNNAAERDTIDYMQENLECCGLNGPTGSEVSNGTGVVMASCCASRDYLCTVDRAYRDGCINELLDFLENSVKIIGIIAIVFALVEVFGAIFAFYVRNTIKKQGQYA